MLKCEQMTEQERPIRRTNKLLGCALVGLIGLLLIVLLYSVPGNDSKPTSSPKAKPRPPGYISAAMLQKEEAWPLSVSEAVVGCDKGMLLWVEIDGERYGLNGSAKSFGYPDFRAFWLFDKSYLRPEEQPVDGHTPRIDIQPLFNRAEQLC